MRRDVVEIRQRIARQRDGSLALAAAVEHVISQQHVAAGVVVPALIRRDVGLAWDVDDEALAVVLVVVAAGHGKVSHARATIPRPQLLHHATGGVGVFGPAVLRDECAAAPASSFAGGGLAVVGRGWYRQAPVTSASTGPAAISDSASGSSSNGSALRRGAWSGFRGSKMWQAVLVRHGIVASYFSRRRVVRQRRPRIAVFHCE